MAGVDPERFLDLFCASEAFAAVSDVGGGISIEEAVYRYCVEAGIGDPAVREEEWLVAIMKALAVNPRPNFAVPVARRGRGWAEVRRGVLYAAVDGRFVTGPVTAAIERALTTGSGPAAVLASLAALGLA